ncbi:unnamed protein product [Brachionus calyciflorus]|uniref:G-protein coupled receptors family 1 profile domain-containing protein n=1 Tax=Brachionus calyciflorus TaxID=104777 RepID=A0A814IUX2_9BILA|nr:unnamed protein product [Brachionus calyciflorus]
MNSSIQNTFERRNQINQTLLIAALYSIIPIGIIFNITQILVYLRRKFTETTMSIYCTTISINNILVLIATGLRFISAIKIYDYEENTYIGCKLASFFIRVVYCACTWLNFLFTLDRLVFILYPQRFKYFRNKINVIKLIICMYAFLSLLNSPSFFIDSSVIEIKSLNKTEFISVCTASSELSITREVVAQLFGIFMPFILIFISNFVLIRKVINSKKKVSIVKDMHFGIILVISNIFFLITFLPFSGLLMIIMVTIVNPTITLNPEIMSIVALYETNAFIIACYNYTFGLFVQICFNKLFREEFFTMFIELNGFVNKNRLNTSSTQN